MGGGGVQKMCADVHHYSAKREVLTAWVRGLFKGIVSSRVLDALSCYLSHILKHSDTRLDLKNGDQFMGGGGGCCAPAWIRHCGIHSRKSIVARLVLCEVYRWRSWSFLSIPISPLSSFNESRTA